MNLFYKQPIPKESPQWYRELPDYRLQAGQWQKGWLSHSNQAYQIIFNEYIRHLIEDRQLKSLACTVHLVQYPNGLYLAFIHVEAPYNVKVHGEPSSN